LPAEGKQKLQFPPGKLSKTTALKMTTYYQFFYHLVG